MMSFTPRNRRNRHGIGDGDQPSPYFEQMHDSIESLDFLDLEGLEKYAGGKTGKRGNKRMSSSEEDLDESERSTLTSTKAVSRSSFGVVPLLAINPGDSLEKILAMANRSSGTTKTLSPPSFDGTENIVSKEQQQPKRRGGKRDSFKRAASQRPSSNPEQHSTPSLRCSHSSSDDKDKASTPPRTLKIPKSPKRIMQALRRNNNTNDLPHVPGFHQMNDCVESFEFLDLKGLEASKSPNDKGSNPPRSLSPSKAAAPQRSTRKSTSKQQVSPPEQAPKTPCSLKEKIRSITPFRTRDVESSENAPSSPVKQRMPLSPFKRSRSQRLVEKPKENEEQVNRGESLEANTLEERLDLSTNSKSNERSSLKARSTTPTRKERPAPILPSVRQSSSRHLQSKAPSRKGSFAVECGSPSTSQKSLRERPKQTVVETPKTQASKKSGNVNHRFKHDPDGARDSGSQCTSNKGTESTRSIRSSRTSGLNGKPDQMEKKSQGDDEHQGRRRQTHTPMRRRPQLHKKEIVAIAAKPQDDDSSTSSSTSSFSSSSSSASSHDAPNDRSNAFPQLAESSLEKISGKIKHKSGTKAGADVTNFAAQSTKADTTELSHYQRPRSFTDMSWTEDAKQALEQATSRNAPSARGPKHENNSEGKEVRQSMMTRQRSHNRSRSTGRASALAASAVLIDAPQTPRSRNRAIDRRSLYINDSGSAVSASPLRSSSSPRSNARCKSVRASLPSILPH